jgi:hypothetical protein
LELQMKLTVIFYSLPITLVRKSNYSFNFNWNVETLSTCTRLRNCQQMRRVKVFI